MNHWITTLKLGLCGNIEIQGLRWVILWYVIQHDCVCIIFGSLTFISMHWKKSEKPLVIGERTQTYFCFIRFCNKRSFRIHWYSSTSSMNLVEVLEVVVFRTDSNDCSSTHIPNIHIYKTFNSYEKTYDICQKRIM